MSTSDHILVKEALHAPTVMFCVPKCQTTQHELDVAHFAKMRVRKQFLRGVFILLLFIPNETPSVAHGGMTRQLDQ
ncbi:hypothetical protein WJ06_06255 [Burkholderia cepacia]|nr:hypothetical protein WI97_25650 [Burkholderia vietnamiensis]KVF23639.1 hypothetical protein WJ06_06255 [Burkholderia cepacia]